MSQEMVVLYKASTQDSHENDSSDVKEDYSRAILLGNHVPSPRQNTSSETHVLDQHNPHGDYESKNADNNNNSSSNAQDDDKKHSTNDSHNVGGNNPSSINACVAVRSSHVSLADQWAQEIAQMSSEEQKRLQKYLVPKRTKKQEEQRAKDREAAGISEFRRLSFDFDPLEGDEVARFADAEETIRLARRSMCSCESDSGNARCDWWCCCSRCFGNRQSLGQLEHQRILCEQLGELSVDELKQLQETKAYAHFNFYRNYIQIVSMFKPVVIICGLIFVYVRVLRMPWEQKHPLVIWSILFYNPSPSDSASTEAVGSLYNGLLVLAAVVGVTAMYVVLLFLNARVCLLRILQLLNMVLLGGPCGYFIYQLFVVYSIPLDMLTFIGCVLNVVGVGWFALNINGNSKTFLTRGYLIALAICMAWPFIEFPEPSVWATLGLLVVYDLFAVLAPCGPLRYIMEAEARLKREGRESKPLPGLVYRGHFFIVGVGDLVFYGALMGQASVPGWETALGCLIGILMGVAGTILWTTSSGKLATPALPMSAVLGLFLRLVVPAFVLPMCHDLSLRSLIV